MNLGKTVFAQLMDFIPVHEFRRCVDRYQGNRKVNSFTCWDQFLSMAFAQLTYRESLRDIETCLRALGRRLYHLGIRGRVSRSTLADANETRDYRIYADLAQILISMARSLYAGEDFGVDLDQAVYALDATIIELCLSLCPWARYRPYHAGVKVHTLLDLEGSIPAFISVKPAKIHEVHVLDELLPEPGSIYIMDRGYLDFARLYHLHQELAFFVIRARRGFRFHRLAARPVDKLTGLRCDQTIRLKSFYPAHGYPDPLRRIRYHDAETHKTLVFLTNNFLLPTLTIAQLYRCRWQVELFFKWIKQHLRIKKFYGLSPNAVKTQIWIAIAVYVLLAIVRKRLGLELDLYPMSQILSVTLLEKMPILQALSHINGLDQLGTPHNQLNLFH
ncbi:MAG TPA: IS4 family transposase [Terriglobales bacterium]|nr:IS4 family transposase [Terriglobales bacterium]